MSIRPGDLADQVPTPSVTGPGRSRSDASGPRRSGLQSLDHVLIGMTLALSFLSIVAIQSLGHGMHIDDHGLDLVVDVITTLVTASVAALAWIWFRENSIVDGLFRASAFVVSTIANLYALLLVGLHTEGLVLVDVLGDGDSQLWVTTICRLVAALLLIAPGAPGVARVAARHPRATVIAPCLLVLAAIPVLGQLGPTLPALAEPFDPNQLPSEMHLPASTGLGIVAQAGIGLLYLVAAAVARDTYGRTGSTGDRFIAIALVFAAFAQFNLAFYPGTFPGLVGVADVLRLGFDVTLLLAVQAEATALIRRMRQANRDLELLRGAEAERAALEERARLSRELHDGVAQDLWLAKLKASRLAALPDLGTEATQLTADIQQAVDAGLTEAQHAVTALRLGTAEGERPLSVLLTNYLDDFADRFGIRVEQDITLDLPRVASRTEAEVLRIAQEALTNVRRHADATVAWVTLRAKDDRILLIVRDNGRGFEPALVGDGYGLAGMRERAALVGGTISILSRPSEGTTLVADIPVDPALPRGTLA